MVSGVTAHPEPTPQDASVTAASAQDKCPDAGLPRFTLRGPRLYDVELPPPGTADTACRAEGRISPSIRNGEQVGYRLSSVWPCSLIARAGLRTGDALLRVNGIVLGPPDELLPVYERLKEAPEVRIEIERDGVPMQVTYRIRRAAPR